ncbi:MAG: DUF1622 domain-containing protein [Actinobacteria bacterium]|uniref:Unannotated protein n=1 Tax=freshwater metagenome TaxID=449393 RepID=A0A6J7DW63_9ZZZZ|nr:DUF1622 domain-containing protein [Actinomycetota bacterium]
MNNLEQVGQAFDWLGVGVIIAAALVTVALAAKAWRSSGADAAYVVTRRTLGRGLLLGLEVLIAADLIRTVAVDLTLESVAALGLLVLIRTVLSFSIQVEIEGNLPWRSPTQR